jgi:hypothetical protein
MLYSTLQPQGHEEHKGILISAASSEKQGRRCKQEVRAKQSKAKKDVPFVRTMSRFSAVFCEEVESEQIKHAAAARFSSEICKD